MFPFSWYKQQTNLFLVTPSFQRRCKARLCAVVSVTTVCAWLPLCVTQCLCVFSSALTMTRNNSINKPPVTHIIRSSRVIDTWRNQSYSRADVCFCAWAVSGINSVYSQVQTQRRPKPERTGHVLETLDISILHTDTLKCHVVFSKQQLYPVHHHLLDRASFSHTHTHTCSPTHFRSPTHCFVLVCCALRLHRSWVEVAYLCSLIYTYTHTVLCKETVMQHGDSTHTSTVLTSASHQMAKVFWEMWLITLQQVATKSHFLWANLHNETTFFSSSSLYGGKQNLET